MIAGALFNIRSSPESLMGISNEKLTSVGLNQAIKVEVCFLVLPTSNFGINIAEYLHYYHTQDRWVDKESVLTARSVVITVLSGLPHFYALAANLRVPVNSQKLYYKIILVTSELALGQRYKSDSAGHVMVSGKYDYWGLSFHRAEMNF